MYILSAIAQMEITKPESWLWNIDTNFCYRSAGTNHNIIGSTTFKVRFDSKDTLLDWALCNVQAVTQQTNRYLAILSRDTARILNQSTWKINQAKLVITASTQINYSIIIVAREAYY